MAARVEVERSGTVRLFRAGPWYRSYLELCAKQECEEAELEGEKKKKKKKKRRSGKRYTRCRVGWAKMQGKVSWAKVVTYRLCQTPPISLNDLASKNPTFLGTLLFLLFFSFLPPFSLAKSLNYSLLISFQYDFDKIIYCHISTFLLFSSWFILRIMKLCKAYIDVRARI